MSSAMAIVLAAGKGTRMESELPKVLVPASGQPLVKYVLKSLADAGIGRSLVVVGYRADDVRTALASYDNLAFVEQTEQLGTGHAVQVCQEHLQDFDGPVVVVTGDSPMLQVDSLRALLELYERERPACILGTLLSDNPEGLGRIVRDDEGKFEAIVEHKDATPKQREINEVNMSTYVFDCQKLIWALGQLRSDNQQNEYYLTDCPGILKEKGEAVQALPVLKPCEALSVNNLADLAAVEAEIQKW